MTGKHGAPTTVAALGFGAALRAARDKQGISQETLAERADVSHGCVSRLESGSRNPSRETVVKLADALALRDADRVKFFGNAGMLEHPGCMTYALSYFIAHLTEDCVAAADGGEGREAA